MRVARVRHCREYATQRKDKIMSKTNINPDSATRAELEAFLGPDATTSVLRNAVKQRIKNAAQRSTFAALQKNPALKAQFEKLMAAAKSS